MSLPEFTTQSCLFSTAALSASLFPETDRYRLFGKLVYPKLAAARAVLEKCYCLENGRVALEPVLMLGVSILQDLDGVPDRQAVELLHYHAGWNFALNRQLGDPVFHSSSLVNFRQRLINHGQSALGFATILEALVEAGLVSRQSRQRLDSTAMFGRVSKMNRLDCVRESLRLALQEVEAGVPPAARPVGWVSWWERYVESQVDYRATSETLGRKLGEAGQDVWQLLEWLRGPGLAQVRSGPQVQLLVRVFAEQFEMVAGQPAPLAQEKIPVEVDRAAGGEPPSPGPTSLGAGSAREASSSEAPKPPTLPIGGVPLPMGPAPVQPKGKGQLDSNRVQNPHDPQVTYAVKGQGQHKKEHVGYKIQVAETVNQSVLAPGEPTGNFLTGIVTHLAYESDEAGALLMEQEQAAMGLEKPPVHYVDGAYISAEKLVRAHAQGRELIGPAQPAPGREGRFRVEDFDIQVEERRAVCPAGQVNTQCSRLVEETTGQVQYRFEFSTQCHDCPLRSQCLGQDQRHRTVVVGQHHTALQTRRREQQTPEFKQRMNHRNAIEGTQSELVRGHGLRQAKYRGLAKVKLQSYLIGAACNVKRWIRREIWKLQQAVSAPAMIQSVH